MVTYAALKEMVEAQLEAVGAVITMLEIVRRRSNLTPDEKDRTAEHVLQLGEHVPRLGECRDMLKAGGW